MSTTFGIIEQAVDLDEYGELRPEDYALNFTEIAIRGNGGSFSWRYPFERAAFAFDITTPVYPLDNSAQGIFTIGDIRKAISEQEL